MNFLGISHNRDNKQIFYLENYKCFLSFVLINILGAQKNHLIETVLLSTQNIYFGCNKKKNY